MPGGNICEENLEQRIERIRKRDEEIEKRHREAEADRLAALQANAMVKMTAPADDDWPKAHKYDKLDFTYDVKTDPIEGDDKKPLDEVRVQQRPFKKFPEGKEPPPDPKFNFLADAERDGKAQAINTPNDSTKNWRVNNNNNSNNLASNNNRRNNTNNGSFNRGRNGAKGKNNPMQKGKSNDEPILRKNDRDRNNDSRLQRQSSEGMWRRVDDKKTDDRQMNFKNDGNAKAINKPSIQQRVVTSKPETEQMQQKMSDLSIEKRGNITVSVTKDGEVKSVRLETARAIGTGRVGGGALRHNIQQQQQPFAPQQPIAMDSNINNSLMNYPVIDQFQPQYEAPLQTSSSSSVPVTPKPVSNIVNGVPFKLPSVQDRLIKNRVFFDGNLKNEAQSGN